MSSVLFMVIGMHYIKYFNGFRKLCFINVYAFDLQIIHF